MDVYEDEHNITLKIEVPGIDEKDIDVRVENNTLTVHGERKFEKEEKEENYRRVERQYGSFTRTFTLPRPWTPKGFGQLRQGRVEDQLAKKAEAKPKQIKVSVGGEKTLEAKASRKQGTGQGRVTRAARRAQLDSLYGRRQNDRLPLIL